jgi:uncharacterized repeat protein (TIGR03803 family)
MKLVRFSPLVLAALACTLSLVVCAQAQTVTFIAQFHDYQGNADSVIQGTDGNFYGSAAGGTYNQGRIFRMTPTGQISTFYSFCSLPNCADGEEQEPSPILGSDGNLYGVSTFGGNATGSGIFYKLTLNGQFTVLYTFCSASACVDGQWPYGVIQGRDGNFYGTTESGGAHNNGVFFRISATGAFKVLYSSCSLANCVDAAGAKQVQGIDGNFYGIGGSGTRGGGAFYQMTPTGKYTALYNFCSYTDTSCSSGWGPSSRVVQDAKGNFFGTTQGGGRNGYGTVFEITPQYQYYIVHSFDTSHGNAPLFGVTLAGDGNLYGYGNEGGLDDGTLFESTPKGAYTELFKFQCCNEGYDPFWHPPFQGTDGLLYGTTLYGPGICCYGTIFTLENGISPLVQTVPTGGNAGQQVLILGNHLTGTFSVTFNGVPAKFIVKSDSYIRAAVPQGATTGTVSVVTPSGTLKSNPQFVVTK